MASHPGQILSYNAPSQEHFGAQSVSFALSVPYFDYLSQSVSLLRETTEYFFLHMTTLCHGLYDLSGVTLLFCRRHQRRHRSFWAPVIHVFFSFQEVV